MHQAFLRARSAESAPSIYCPVIIARAITIKSRLQHAARTIIASRHVLLYAQERRYRESVMQPRTNKLAIGSVHDSGDRSMHRLLILLSLYPTRCAHAILSNFFFYHLIYEVLLMNFLCFGINNLSHIRLMELKPQRKSINFFRRMRPSRVNL